MEDGLEFKGPPQPSEAYLKDAYARFSAYPVDFLKPIDSNAEQEALKLEKESNNPQIERLCQWVDRANIRGLVEDDYPDMGGSCGVSSDAVKRAAELLGFDAPIYQLVEVARAYGIEQTKINVFSHGFNIVKADNGEEYVIDLTFPQFVKVDTKELATENYYIGKNMEDSFAYPIVRQLFTRGILS